MLNEAEQSKTGADSPDIATLFERHRGGMKASEVAKILGFDRTTIYAWAAQDRIPVVKIGTQLVFDPARLALWWRSKEVPEGLAARGCGIGRTTSLRVRAAIRSARK